MKARNVLALALTAGLCMASPLLGQTKVDPAAQPKEQPVADHKPRTDQDAEVRVPTVRLDVDFPGGKLREYVATLREVTKPNVVNVVAPEAVLNVKLGELSLRQVTIETAVKSVEWAIDPRGPVVVQQIGPNSYGFTSGRRYASPADAPPPPAVAIQVLSLKELTEPLPGDTPQSRVTVEPDVVLTAVGTALESNEGDPAELKFHKDSGLLIVRGTPDQLQAASSVLDRMQSDVRMRRRMLREAMAGQSSIDELRAEVDKQNIRNELLEQNYARARMEMDRLEAMKKQGAISEGDYNASRSSLDRAKAEHEAARVDAAMAKARLDLLEKRMTEAAAVQQRAGAEAVSDFPPERSTVMYTAKRFGAKDLESIAAAVKSLSERLSGKAVEVRVEGGTLTVTAERESHMVIRRALLEPGNTKNGFVMTTLKTSEEKLNR